jgi:hypothetical protein
MLLQHAAQKGYNPPSAQPTPLRPYPSIFPRTMSLMVRKPSAAMISRASSAT